MLGHASAELALRTYSHLMPSDDGLDFLSKSRPDQNRTNRPASRKMYPPQVDGGIWHFLEHEARFELASGRT
jgi:hypothetical protein